MATNTQETKRNLLGIPTVMVTNTDTGAADLYADEGIFGRTLIASGSAIGNNWTITNENDFLKKVNNKRTGAGNPPLSQQDLNKQFQTDGTKLLNNDRASVINKNSPANTKTYLATQAKVPGIVDPATGKQTDQTAPTVAPDGSQNGPGTTDGSTTEEYNFAETDKKIAEVQKAISGVGRDPKKYSNAKYPLDLDSNNQDCIKFTVLSHSPQKVSTAEFEKGGVFAGRGDTRNRGGTVTLPIQPSITDTNSVNWGGLDVDAASALTSAAATAAITGGGEGISSALEGGAALLQSKAGSESIKSAIALGFVSTNKNFFTKATGAIANPNLELLFQGPTLRQFTFNFVMSAREQDESEEIRKIIRFFKQAMSVKRSNTALFLKAPHTFEIKYLHKTNEHSYLNKIKECALLNFTVDYTPAGNYATYEDGAMTLYALTMTFQELDPIYDDDYTKLSGGDNDQSPNYQIGY